MPEQTSASTAKSKDGGAQLDVKGSSRVCDLLGPFHRDIIAAPNGSSLANASSRALVIALTGLKGVVTVPVHVLSNLLRMQDVEDHKPKVSVSDA